jgi:hypothetical protein
MHVVGRLTRMPLPQVSTAPGRQGQVPFSLPGWDLVVAVADEQPFGDHLSFIVDAVPNAGQTINIEAIETLGLLLQRILGFLAGSNVGVVPVVGLNALAVGGGDRETSPARAGVDDRGSLDRRASWKNLGHSR